MRRYFLELGYFGAKYAGFQIQKNANTIQAEVENALSIFYRTNFELTGSSRTDSGVNALQNYFHFDFEVEIGHRDVYHLNSILPRDIVIRSIRQVRSNAHCRFDALQRSYAYHVYAEKNPFLRDRAYFYPYPLDFTLLNNAAALLLEITDFTTFSKRNTQVNTFNCKLLRSEWRKEKDQLIYCVTGDRFLRGMVRGLAGTILRVGSGKISLPEFENIIAAKDYSRADFSVPGHALFLETVKYAQELFI